MTTSWINSALFPLPFLCICGRGWRDISSWVAHILSAVLGLRMMDVLWVFTRFLICIHHQLSHWARYYACQLPYSCTCFWSLGSQLESLTLKSPKSVFRPPSFKPLLLYSFLIFPHCTSETKLKFLNKDLLKMKLKVMIKGNIASNM